MGKILDTILGTPVGKAIDKAGTIATLSLAAGTGAFAINTVSNNPSYALSPEQVAAHVVVAEPNADKYTPAVVNARMVDALAAENERRDGERKAATLHAESVGMKTATGTAALLTVGSLAAALRKKRKEEPEAGRTT